jgi:hypothetical protein
VSPPRAADDDDDAACNGRRYLLVYASEGCQPQNRLFYLDLQQIPKAEGSDALDFSSFDFFKGEAWSTAVFFLQDLSRCGW